MSWLLILVLAVLGVSALVGYRKGFVKIAYSLLSMIVALFLVSIVAPHVHTVLVEKTPVYDKMVTICAEQIQSKVDETVSTTSDSLSELLAKSGIQLPSALTKVIDNMGIESQYTENVSDKAAAVVANWILYIISFVVSYIAVIIVLKVLEKTLDLLTKLPIIKGANKGLGIAAGILQGLVYVWIAALLVSVFCTTNIGQQAIVLIEENAVLKFLYDHNGLIYLATLFF